MTLRQSLLTVALAAVWGSSYLLIKYALEGFRPEVIVFLRAAGAAAALAVVVRFQGPANRAAVRRAFRRPGIALLLGLLAIAAVGGVELTNSPVTLNKVVTLPIAAPFTLISFGELHVPSGLTAVLIAPVPLFVAAFAPFLDREEIISPRQAAGLVVGLAGVGLLVGVETIDSLPQFLGAIGVLGACASYALSGFVVKRRFRDAPSISTSLVSVSAAAALTVVPAALTFGGAGTPGLRAILSVLALGVIHTALAFVLFYKLLAELGPGRGSLVAYLAPAVALAYGAVLLDEAVTPPAVAGLVLILAGVLLASRRAPEPVAATASAPSE